MTEEKVNKHSQQTVCNRSAINANWNALLSINSLKINSEKKSDLKQTEKFTGTFRRIRKKNKNKIKNINTKQDDSLQKNFDKKHETGSRLSNSDILKERDSTCKQKKLTRVVAMDCEMVGVGMNGSDNMLARVSIVNRFGDCIYDKFVKAREEVTDYRTQVSGVRREDLLNGEDFSVVQREVAEMLRGRVLVGHSVKHDLDVLLLSHPRKSIRDTSKYKPFKMITKGKTPSLKRLTSELLGAEIQSGEHSSVVDARAAMMLYARMAAEWEKTAGSRRSRVVPTD